MCILNAWVKTDLLVFHFVSVLIICQHRSLIFVSDYLCVFVLIQAFHLILLIFNRICDVHVVSGRTKAYISFVEIYLAIYLLKSNI